MHFWVNQKLAYLDSTISPSLHVPFVYHRNFSCAKTFGTWQKSKGSHKVANESMPQSIGKTLHLAC